MNIKFIMEDITNIDDAAAIEVIKGGHFFDQRNAGLGWDWCICRRVAVVAERVGQIGYSAEWACSLHSSGVVNTARCQLKCCNGVLGCKGIDVGDARRQEI